VRSLTLGEAFFPSLMQNVPGGDTILNNFDTNAFMPVIEAFKNNENEKAARALITGVMGDSLVFPNLPQWQREIMMANTVELRGIMFSENIFPQVTCDDIKKIKVPVLLLNGDKSPVVFSSMRDELNGCLSNKEKATLLNTSHGLEQQNPVEFNKIDLGSIDKH